MKIKDYIIIITGFVGVLFFAGMLKGFFIEETKECLTQILPTEKIYMHPYGTIEDPYREDLHGEIRCSCVRYARSLGVELPYELQPKDLQPNARIEVGISALFIENHIGVVSGIGKKGFWIKESNYVECEITERFINFNDYRLRGFYK
jgi:hypothetical protein